MEQINCIFCHTENAKVVIHENGYTGIKCSSCSLIYINPRPSFNEIIDLYGHDNAHATAESHIKFSYGKKLYSKHTLEIIRKYVKGKLLEIGAGAGYFLNEARKQGFDVYGIEFNQIQAEFIKEQLNIPCELRILSNNTFNDTQFDVIYHCDVISHFYDPIEEFRKINNKLKSKGYVVFETGNLGDVDIKYFKYFSKFQYPDHLFFFSEKNINTILEKTEFELIKVYRYSILPQLFVMRFLGKINSYIKPKKNIKETGRGDDRLFIYYSNLFHFIRNRLKKVYTFIYYLLRYKLGYILPKNDKPQTVIIVARKK